MVSKKNSQTGFVALLSVVLLLGTLLFVVASFSFSVIASQKIGYLSSFSAQAYYTAEAGLEDILYRATNFKNYDTENALQIGDSQTTVTVADNGSKKTILSGGNKNNLFRKVQAVISSNTDEVSFFYGAQIGEGGLSMSNNSHVEGGVHSAGGISGANGASITGDVFVSGTNTLYRMVINGNAYANNISRCTINGDAYYQSISNSTVTGTEYPGSPDPEPEELPISEEQIAKWKDDAEQGGVIYNSYVVSGGASSLGPKKIEGSLIVTNNANLTITGTVYVTDSIIISNSAKIIQGENYEDSSAVVLSDGSISVSNNAVFQPNSADTYLLFLSTSAGPAIVISNNATGVIFYASAGTAVISNNAQLKELTAYQLVLSNGAQITYESGLASVNFSSGSGGSWEVSDWEEVP